MSFGVIMPKSNVVERVKDCNYFKGTDRTLLDVFSIQNLVKNEKSVFRKNCGKSHLHLRFK